MKKLFAIVLCILVLSPGAVLAEGVTAIRIEGPLNEIAIEESEYINLRCKITDIEDNRLTVSNEQETYVYNLSDNVLVMNNRFENIGIAGLKTGQSIMVAYNVSTPVTLSLPPQLTPEVIIVMEQGIITDARVDIFDNNLLSSGKDFKLNISGQTKLVDLNGTDISTDAIKGGTLLVFHTLAANSFPMQTTPDRVVLIKRAVKCVSKNGIIDDVIDNSGSMSILVKNDDGEQIIYHLSDSTILMNAETQNIMDTDGLKKGQAIVTAYKDNTPMTSSLPPQMTPMAIIVTGADDKEQSPVSVKVDIFDKNYLSSDGGIKLNVSEETNVVDVSGAKIEASRIIGETSIVFYTITTRSIPPQTPPIKVVVISLQSLGSEEVSEITGDSEIKLVENSEKEVKAAIIIKDLSPEESFNEDGVTYIALAVCARKLGYEVTWSDATKTVMLQKGPVSYLVKIGDKEYGYNRAINYFTNAPKIINDRTFVEKSFITTIA